MQNRKSSFVLFLCIASIGCYATIAQVLLIREFLNIFYGNELCLGIVFGAWFLGIASGAFAGIKFECFFKQSMTVFIVFLFSMCLVLPVQIVTIRGVRHILNIGTGEYISLLPLLSITVSMVLPFSFIIGIVFPFSSKVVRGITRDTASDIGSVYIIESMGSLIGGLIFSFYLVSKFHSIHIVTLMNAGMFFILFLMQYVTQKKGAGEKRGNTHLLALGLTLVMIILWFSPVPERIDAWTTKIRWNAFTHNIELVASADSRYQHIDIGKQADQYNVYLNGHFAFAFPNEYDYAQIAHLVMTQHPSPKNVLVIGGGFGGLLTEMLFYPIERLDYVEIDQKLLHITSNYLSPSEKKTLSDHRINIFHQDGRYYIKHLEEKHSYDIVFVNVPDPSTAFLNRFYTRNFFEEIQTILKPDGIIATSVSSSVTYIGKEVGSYTGSLYKTLHETFREVKVTPGQTNFYFACGKKGIITLDWETLMERYKQQGIQSDYFNEYLFYTLLQPEQVDFIETQLQQRKDLVINTDAKPVAYFLNLVLWDAFAGGNLHSFFYRLKNTGIKYFLIPIAFTLAGRILYLSVRKRRTNTLQLNSYYRKTHALIALATTGFTGMALEIILLYAFQNIYGYIYERIGVIVSLFMAGLAFGGYVANKMIRKKQFDWIKVLLFLEGVIVVYAITVPFLISIVSVYSSVAEAALIFLVMFTGILTGIEFPIVNKICAECDDNIATSAGATDGADHIGAFLGSLLTGILFLPLLGVYGSCLVLTVLNISSLILLVLLNIPQNKRQAE
ncbi:MAG: fused MFS/spermidine synthase [Candidatus Kuenenia sp.]|nr:fused MFS/spermidine synthase [Candidatus Kuenenia hertensis]